MIPYFLRQFELLKIEIKMIDDKENEGSVFCSLPLEGAQGLSPKTISLGSPRLVIWSCD